MKRFKKASDIRVGTIGYGGAFNMGRAHLREMQKAGMTPVCVAEIDASRLEVAKTDFPGIETYTSVSKMLKKSPVDLLAIITPHNTHADLTLQCLRAGKMVVSEKPFAITTGECDAMIQEARKQRLPLSTYHNRHWDGCILKAVDEIREKKTIGDVVRIEAHMGGFAKPGDWWRTSKSISGGILYDWGVHLLEYALQILGDAKIKEVTGFNKTGVWKTKWGQDTNESEGQAIVRFNTGQWLNLTISSIESHPKQGWLEITGTKGSYIFEGGSYEIITHRGPETVVKKGKNPPGEGWKLYQNVADHLVKGQKLIITGEWARRPIHILDLACQSAKKGTTLKAKYS